MPCEGETCLCKHFGRPKIIFSIANLQVNDSLGGKTMQNFSFGKHCPPCPSCRYLLEVNEVIRREENGGTALEVPYRCYIMKKVRLKKLAVGGKLVFSGLCSFCDIGIWG